MTASVIDAAQQAVNVAEQALRALWATGYGAAVLFLLAAIAAAAAVIAGVRRRRDGRFTRDLGRLAAIATAAAAAWLVAGAAGSAYQSFAAAAAVGSVGLGIAYSTRDAISGVAATAAGLLCAFAVLHTGAPDLLSVLAAAGVGWGVATWFGANSETAAAAAIASVFATSLGDRLTEAVIVDRLIATVIGAVVGIAVSSLPWWGTPGRAAEADVRTLAGRVGGVWQAIADTVADGATAAAAKTVLDDSRAVLEDSEQVRVRVQAAVAHMRYSPISSAREEGTRLARLGTAVCHGAAQANNAARALFDLVEAGQSASLNPGGPLQAAAGTAADVYAGIATSTLYAVDAAALAGRLDRLASQAAGRMRRDDDTDVLLLGSQLVAAAAATSDALYGTPAIDTDMPAVDDVVPALKPLRRH